MSINEDNDHILCTCNDRALRLYSFDFSNVASNSKKDSSKNITAKSRKRIIYFKNEIKDHINNMKW